MLRKRRTGTRGPQGRAPGGPQGSGPRGSRKSRPTKPLSVTELRRKAGTLPKKPRSKATSRPAIVPGKSLKDYFGNRPQISQAAGMAGRQSPMASLRVGKGAPIQRPTPVIPQRPIPNRDGRMALMQAELANAQKLRGQQSLRGVFSPDRANPSRNLPPTISMDPRRGTFGRGMRQSDYMRQQMPAQQLQRGMGRGPMQRANIGQIQAPRPTFGQQMRPIAPGQRLRRGRMVLPRRISRRR